MFLHTGERPYRCQSCQSSFTARDRLKGHILKHHPDHPAAQELHSLNKVQQAQTKTPSSNQKSNRKRKHSSPSPTPPSCNLTENPSSAEENNNKNSLSVSCTTTTGAPNFILQWPATIQVGSDGNLCWQATSLDAGTHFNEVATVSPPPPTTTTTTAPFSQILIQQETTSAVQNHPNPLDVAIKEIIEVNNPIVELDFASQMTRFADKLKALQRQQSTCSTAVAAAEQALPTTALPKETTVFVCDKCGREYKYKSFLQVHQKRKCGQF